jgi:hypothetical protein
LEAGADPNGRGGGSDGDGESNTPLHLVRWIPFDSFLVASLINFVDVWFYTRVLYVPTNMLHDSWSNRETCV